MNQPTSNQPTNISIEQAFQHGVSLYQHHKKEEARQIFELILTQAPNAIPVLQVLAVMDLEKNDWKAALKKLDHALDVEPNNASVLFDKAQLFTQQGFYQDAFSLIDTLLQQTPDNIELLQLKQVVTQRLGQQGESRRTAKKIKHQPPDIHLLEEIAKTFNLATQMIQEEKLEQAEQLFHAILSLSPDQKETLLQLGRLELRLEKNALAKQTFLRIWKQDKSNKDVASLLCHTNIVLEQYQDARKIARYASNAWPDEILFHQLQTLSYEKECNWLEGIKSAKKGLGLDPRHTDLWYRLTVCRYHLLREKYHFTQDAIRECYNNILHCLAICEADKPTLNLMLGELLYYQGNAEKAASVIQHYIDHHPDDLDAAFNICFVYRALQQWDNYYVAYEKGLESGARMVCKGSLPQWNLSRPKDDKVLIMPEQGIGDELIYCHNVGLVSDNAQKVYLASEPRLVPLLQSAFPKVHVFAVIRKTGETVQIDDAILNDITSWISGGSLAGVCYHALERHYYQARYVYPSLDLTKNWRKKIDDLMHKEKKEYVIGISWRSGLRGGARNLHYLTPLEMAHFCQQFDNALFINLQYDDCEKDIKKIEKHSQRRIHVFPELDLKNDFVQTSALIACLQQVVTAGTAIHRLTVATGTPCHVFIANTQDDQPELPVNLSSPKEIGYFFPPLLKNKFPMLESIALNVKKNLSVKNKI